MIIPFSTVAVPTLAKLKHDMPAFRQGYVRMVSASAMISLPAIAGIGVLADAIIPLLFGQQWSESIPLDTRAEPDGAERSRSVSS